MKHIKKDQNEKSFSEAQQLLNRYRRYFACNRLKSIMRDVYHGLCVYCESSIEHSSYVQIDHFYPKAKYMSIKKDYRNLHFSCQRCNNIKGSKNPFDILSPNYYLMNGEWRYSDPRKIEDELIYCGPFIFSVNKNPNSIDRGKNTIDMFDLNAKKDKYRASSRRYLLEMRIREYKHIYNVINALYVLMLNYSDNIDSAIKLLFDDLLSMTKANHQYSTMNIHNFGRSIINLIKIYYIMKRSAKKTKGKPLQNIINRKV